MRYPVCALKILTLGIAGFGLTSETSGRVYHQNRGELLNAQALQARGWNRVYQSDLKVNAQEHDVEMWHVDQPPDRVLAHVRHLAKSAGHPITVFPGDGLGWALVPVEDDLIRLLVFEAARGTGSFVLSNRGPRPRPTEIPNAVREWLPPDARKVRTLMQPDSGLELIQARSSRPAPSLRAMYRRQCLEDGWTQGVGGLWRKKNQIRAVHLLSTGQPGEIQITILTSKQHQAGRHGP